MSNNPLDHLSRLTITLVTELDEQGLSLMRQLQRTRATIHHRWPIPERIGEACDMIVCEYAPDLSRRYSWMPGEATAASIILLPQSETCDVRGLQSALPDAVIHRPYSSSAVLSAMVVGWDHFSFCRRQRTRIARLDENIRNLRHIERAKQLIMADKNINEHKAFNVLRSMAMERRMSIAALAGYLVDSQDNVR